MSKGNQIIVSSHPRGLRQEGVINGALKPGTCVQIDISEGIRTQDGRFQWEAYNPVVVENGAKALVAVLMEDYLQGTPMTQAYVSGARCFVYIPVMGEELNVLLTDISGTADDHSFGDKLMIGAGTGTLLAAAGSPESEPFMLLEAVTDPTADTLAHVIYTGY